MSVHLDHCTIKENVVSMHVTELPGLLPLVGASWNGWISHQICAKNIVENPMFFDVGYCPKFVK